MRSPGPKTGARRSLGPLTVIAELSFLPSRLAQEQSLEEKQLWPREDTGSCSAPAMRQGLRQRRRGKEDVGAVRACSEHCAGAGSGPGTLQGRLVCSHWDP